MFLDDRRSFANVDALLTRLAPVSTVYVACTEGGDFDAGSGGGSGGGGGGRGKKDGGAASASAEVAALLKRLASVVESRDDVAPGGRGGDDEDDHDGATDGKIDVRVLPSLSRSKATSLAESTLRRLLGGEGTEAHLAYRGDRHLAEEPMVLWCLGCLFSADGGSHFAPSSYSGGGDDDDDCDNDDGNDGGGARRGGGGGGGGGGAYRLVPGTMGSHLSMDRTAAEAIHLLPPRTGSGQALITGGNAMNNSLYGVLNRCKTRMGRCVLLAAAFSLSFVSMFRSFLGGNGGGRWFRFYSLVSDVMGKGDIRLALPSIYFLTVVETAI